MQRAAAGRQNRELRAICEQRCNHVPEVKMFQVVEEQKVAATRERVPDIAIEHFGGSTDMQSLSDFLTGARLVANRRQPDDMHPIWKAWPGLADKLHRKTRFPDSAGAGHRHQTVRLQC